MIDDANLIEENARLDCDLCIVGAGAAGIAIALQFLRADLRVILLESGGIEPDRATQALYQAELADPAMHSPGDKYRERRFGGSTTIWGGRCMPFDRLDFEGRPWVTGQTWPIGYDDVAPYYPAANALCEAGAYDYDARTAVPGGMRPMLRGFTPAHFTTDGIERFSCPTNFADRYQHRLAASQNVRVLLQANVTELLCGDDGERIEQVPVRTLRQRGFSVTARQVVLATGGLEVPRLLLASRRTQAAGLGNLYDQVGRSYMCHIAGTLGDLQLDLPRDAVAHGYEIAEDGAYVRRRLAMKPDVQQDLGIASSIARLHFPTIVDPAHGCAPLSALYLAKPFISYEYAKRLAEDTPPSAARWLRHVGNVARDPVGLASFMLHWVRRRTLSARKFPSVIVRTRHNRFTLDYHAEQTPNPDSRVSLSKEVDVLGMPKLRIDWRHSALDVHTARETLRVLRDDIAAWGHGVLAYDPARIEQDILRYGAYGGHHIGTARMAASPLSGVVNADCRVHGTKNLYVAGSAVFATSSQANPTLTIVALALRLAAHLRHPHEHIVPRAKETVLQAT
jgi:choline dehydrogenase-like flavoprotein